MKIVITLIALVLGGWLTFDGVRAFATGDYVTARTGDRAGQLGPWSKVVSAIGLDPRGTFMKSFHVGLGCTWLVALLVFWFQPGLGRCALAASAVASLWYLPLGTVLSLIEIGLLIVVSRSGGAG